MSTLIIPCADDFATKDSAFYAITKFKQNKFEAKFDRKEAVSGADKFFNELSAANMLRNYRHRQREVTLAAEESPEPQVP